jgi:hypothetical protein
MFTKHNLIIVTSSAKQHASSNMYMQPMTI